MIIVNPLHWYYSPAHLEEVTAEMRRRGAPRLRAHFDGEVWHAREGTHRLRAAKALGVAPVLIPVKWWRGKASLERARYAAIRDGHVFDRVEVIEWQDGRLVLGWALTKGVRLVDLAESHPAWAERRERLSGERAKRGAR
jgi:hypothetical protein